MPGFDSTGSLLVNVVTSTPIITQRSIVADDSAALTDHLILASGTLTLTLPAAADCFGQHLYVKNIGTGLVTVDASGAELIDDSLIVQLTAWECLEIVCTGTGWVIV